MITLPAIAVVSGIQSHMFYFKLGDHCTYGTRYTCLAAVLPLFSILLLTGSSTPFPQAFRIVLIFSSYYLLGLYTSILMYRIAPFHRLYTFPGPFSYRVSKLFHAFENGSSNFQSYRSLYKIHEQYGDLVRTGPSELSIIDPEVVEAIFSSTSECSRSVWYGMADPIKAIFHTRDRSEHDKRKTLWGRGLSANKLRMYESRIQTHIARLVEHISKSADDLQPLNSTLWFNYFSFDVMGEVGFGRGFNMLEKGEKPHVLKILEDGQCGLGIFGVVPWLFMILTRIPWISAEHGIFVQWCQKQMMERMGRKSTLPDIASELIKHDAKATDESVSYQWLFGDSRILIVAGSDAVASSLVFAFYYLARYPEHAHAIRQELEQISEHTMKEPNATELQSQAPSLNAFITEVLRLWPPNPSGVLRQTPSAGLTVGQRHIPGDVTICTPFWALHRSEQCFVHPHAFLPQRWSTNPELVLHKGAYIPFGRGAYACVGKQLALMELRLVIAQLVNAFDIEVADDGSEQRLLQESKDWFTWGLPPVMLQFRKRREAHVR